LNFRRGLIFDPNALSFVEFLVFVMTEEKVKAMRNVAAGQHTQYIGTNQTDFMSCIFNIHSSFHGETVSEFKREVF